ncbi:MULTISPECIES: hypothetical protein [Streptomyces]|uniref:hypothetical protein n=1 Tax=Streptomyces scabiei TaxID=1930 RepID=UPI0004E7345D|nr:MULTISPECIES: hypothetical protein [Streptomyces]MBP5869074.1 hypothetical protein [Streptomyces sp. LBUM 1485]KFG10500.1 hypothetical protein IQ61_02390 [Streptomyces scabiei]MBP5891776.1 hypothetical protein [Streptomyces sp. LBUM 1481]MBP5915000.1 hypothetical protein [Streptomyces sp. LBUM 1486]MBP5921932.1 hypothetical protein [Streptomyces sp. LBUM 1483]
MADIYAVDVSMNLAATLPDAVLSELRRHLGHEGTDDGVADDCDDHPVWAARGPARRIGGVLIGELVRTDRGWALAVRQEVHAETMPQVDSLIEVLASHSTTEGAIGQIRFYEDEIPDLLLNRSGELMKVSLSRLPETQV